MKMRMKFNDGSIEVNGDQIRGKSITIENGEIFVDGEMKKSELFGDINITINGDVESLENANGTVKANNVGKISTMSGDVECGDVSGNVSTMSGDIECDAVAGKVETMSGDITYV